MRVAADSVIVWLIAAIRIRALYAMNTPLNFLGNKNIVVALSLMKHAKATFDYGLSE